MSGVTPPPAAYRRPRASLEDIHASEARAARAWPPAEQQDLDGWTLRYNHGLHRRVNSVLPNGTGSGLAMAERLRAVDAYYRDRGEPPRFQISPACHPADLDEILARNEYAVESGVDVQWATTEEILKSSRTAEARRTIAVLDEPTERWIDVHLAGEEDQALKARKQAMLRRITSPRAFLLAEEDGQARAAVVAAFEGGWTGLFGMYVLVEHRRCGWGRDLMTALARWTVEQGGHSVYLQVEQDNPGAAKLYASAGFSTVYAYYYRTRWI